MKLTQKNNWMIGLIMGILFIIPYISAFGTSIAYNAQEKPLYLGPGESKDFSISLTASPGKTTTTNIEITKGSEVASLSDGNKNYDIPAGGEIPVSIKIKIPNDAVEGTEYLVGFLLTDVTSSANQGTVGFGGSSEISFKVIVKIPETPVAEPEKLNNTLWLVLIIIILLAIVIVIYFYSKQKKSNVKRK